MIGIAYYLMILQNQQKNQKIALDTRQAQFFQSIYNRYQDEKFVEAEMKAMSYDMTDMNEFIEKYGIEGLTNIVTVGRYFEGLGVNVARNLIDVQMVDDLMSSVIIEFWEKGKQHIAERRKEVPQYAEYFEYLYEQVKAIAKQEHPDLKEKNMNRWSQLSKKPELT